MITIYLESYEDEVEERACWVQQQLGHGKDRLTGASITASQTEVGKSCGQNASSIKTGDGGVSPRETLIGSDS